MFGKRFFRFVVEAFKINLHLALLIRLPLLSGSRTIYVIDEAMIRFALSCKLALRCNISC